MLTDKIKKILKDKEFVYVATANLEGRPNAAPKFLVKIDNNYIYLLDYVIGKTWENLSVNPRVSISFKDNENFNGYQVNGVVNFITSGKEFDSIVENMKEKQISLTAERVVKGVQRGRKHKNFQVDIPEKGVVIKIKVEEVVEIGATGALEREKF